MPKVEVEISEDGKVGTLPEALQKHFEAKFNEAFGKGAEKATRERDAEIKKLKEQGELNATERARLSTLEREQSELSEALAKAKGDHQEAERILKDRHDKDLKAKDETIAARDAELTKRTARIQQAAVKDAIAIAAVEGARKESLAELEELFGNRIGLDDALQPVVKDKAGQTLLDKDSKPVTVEGFVQQYLADHPHHKAATPGRGGGPRGGRSLTGDPGKPGIGDAEFDALVADPSHHNATAFMAKALAVQAGAKP